MPTSGQEYTNTTRLAGLDRVTWDQLDHAYGPADDVPEMLRGTCDPDQTLKALGDLSTSVQFAASEAYERRTGDGDAFWEAVQNAPTDTQPQPDRRWSGHLGSPEDIAQIPLRLPRLHQLFAPNPTHSC